MKLLQFILFSFFFIGLLSCGREGEPAVTDALTPLPKKITHEWFLSKEDQLT